MSRALAIDSSSQPKQQGSIDSASDNLQERIKLRAYELYEARGRVDGHDEEDWVNAETEVRNQSQIHKAG